MKIIILSPEVNVTGETSIVNALLKEGLEYFHLRKPNAEQEELKEYLSHIEPDLRSKVSLHQHLEIADEFGISRVHFNEVTRETMEADLLNKIPKDFSLSTSFHELDAAIEGSRIYDYFFLSPVYDSISKNNYKARFNMPVPDLGNKAIALGGVTPDKMDELHQWNYSGAAFLGAVWQHPENAINTFKKAKSNAERICA